MEPRAGHLLRPLDPEDPSLESPDPAFAHRATADHQRVLVGAEPGQGSQEADRESLQLGVAAGDRIGPRRRESEGFSVGHHSSWILMITLGIRPASWPWP